MKSAGRGGGGGPRRRPILFQVLSLPEAPVLPPVRLLKTPDDMLEKDPATIHRTICEALGKDPDELLQF